MRKIINWIIEFFRLKCPKCGGILVYHSIHIFKDGSEKDIYECTNCKKKFI